MLVKKGILVLVLSVCIASLGFAGPALSITKNGSLSVRLSPANRIEVSYAKPDKARDLLKDKNFTFDKLSSVITSESLLSFYFDQYETTFIDYSFTKNSIRGKVIVGHLSKTETSEYSDKSMVMAFDNFQVNIDSTFVSGKAVSNEEWAPDPVIFLSDYYTLNIPDAQIIPDKRGYVVECSSSYFGWEDAEGKKQIPYGKVIVGTDYKLEDKSLKLDVKLIAENGNSIRANSYRFTQKQNKKTKFYDPEIRMSGIVTLVRKEQNVTIETDVLEKTVLVENGKAGYKVSWAVGGSTREYKVNMKGIEYTCSQLLEPEAYHYHETLSFVNASVKYRGVDMDLGNTTFYFNVANPFVKFDGKKYDRSVTVSLFEEGDCRITSVKQNSRNKEMEVSMILDLPKACGDYQRINFDSVILHSDNSFYAETNGSVPEALFLDGLKINGKTNEFRLNSENYAVYDSISSLLTDSTVYLMAENVVVHSGEEEIGVGTVVWDLYNGECSEDFSAYRVEKSEEEILEAAEIVEISEFSETVTAEITE